MPHVLIVEDDLSIAFLLEEQLEADGYQVTGVARSLKEAVASAEEHDPDFAVIDLHLAGGDLGTDVARSLREITSVGIIFSTGNNDQDLTAFGGDALMSKPYRMSDVGRGFKIMGEMAQLGHTELSYPRNFRLIAPALS
ncbi:MAG: response regulator [Acetobacteraceae bacterium]|nr:response regulator [Acetobacteraceae bacterium]